MRAKHIVGTAVVFIIAATCVRLGFWQLDRLQQKRDYNASLAQRSTMAPALLLDLLADGGSPDDISYRHATASGVFEPDHEFILFGREREGETGNHVLTPLRLADGSVVLVDRGWVPEQMDQPPIADAPPPIGTVTVTGLVLPTESDGGPPLGDRRLVTRVDIGQLAQAIGGRVAPVWLLQSPEAGVPSPVPGVPPDALPEPQSLVPLDEGPHLGYAVQWYSFAVIAIVGWGILVRRDWKEARS